MKSYEKIFVEINGVADVIVTSSEVTTGKTNIFGNSSSGEEPNFQSDVENSNIFQGVN